MIDAAFVCRINAQITRSGPLHPGQLRTNDQAIGVDTSHGRHEPAALTEATMNALIEQAAGAPDTASAAIELFITLAKAQPFEDGNKRTALFSANALLLAKSTGLLLTVPVNDASSGLSDQFIGALARAYLFDDSAAAKNLLRTHGLNAIK